MDVAIGVIVNNHQQILITQRSMHVKEPGRWEFPGGKLEPGEFPEAALKREIFEEVNLKISAPVFLCHLSQGVAPDDVQLFVYYITQFTGDACCLEKQLDLKWSTLDELKNYTFPAINNKIIGYLLALKTIL